VISNAYRGDTPTYESHPIFCIKYAQLSKPTYVPINTHTTPGGALRESWSGAYVGFTKDIKGIYMTSRAVADSFCAVTFGSGFRMAEHHDGDQSAGNAGWGFWGEYMKNSPGHGLLGRVWVAINDQKANSWN
jgi:hypothetical protein